VNGGWGKSCRPQDSVGRYNARSARQFTCVLHHVTDTLRLTASTPLTHSTIIFLCCSTFYTLFFPPLFPALRNTQLQLVAQHSDTNLEHFNGFILTYPFKQECRHMELGMSDVNMSSISSSSSRSVLGSGGGGSSSSGSNSILLHFLADSTA
jgi:hypothetical protein